MKYLLLVAVCLFLTPLPVRWTQPHRPIQPQHQVTSGIDHQQPTGDPPPLPPEAYPGQREHARPPEDFFCTRQTFTLDVPPEKACTCERMFDPVDPTVVHEDHHCTVYCHMDKCSCGISGKPPHDHH